MNSRSKSNRLQCKPKSVQPSSKGKRKCHTISNLIFNHNHFPEPDKKSEIIETKNPLNTTPINRRSYQKDDTDEETSSPFVLRFTQDSCDDDMDVIWDWDSPKSHGNRHIHRKRILQSSPNIPRKHVMNEKSQPKFNSLKAELEQLANSLHNQETKDVFVKPKTPEPENTDDLFGDDILDEEMFKCSQQIEESINIKKMCTSVLSNNNLVNKFENKFMGDTTIQDDSFDCFLEEIKDDEIELFSQQSGGSEFDHPTQPLIIDDPKPPINRKPDAASPRSIARTNSVPAKFLSKLSTSSITSSTFQRTKSEDLGAKPSQCSPEEIEKKRLEAKAKLEFKRKEKEIEKKRLEALERLKRNRMQRMMCQNSGTNHVTNSLQR